MGKTPEKKFELETVSSLKLLSEKGEILHEKISQHTKNIQMRRKLRPKKKTL
jgi:hypothetical protein